MNNLIGQHLGPYRVLEQIGSGGMATVYKAYQPAMDRYVAIKVLPAVLSRDPAFLKRFRREAKVVAKLEHKHILPVHDYGEQEGVTYLVMRYVEAGTLKDRLAAGRLDLPEIYRIIAQVGAALDYAHRLGVIHRDVKPSNVLIDSQGDAYLTDFGLARMVESSEQLTATGVGVGTPAYMAPEQGQGLKIDHRSDVYSLGVMLYEMVTGRVPYQAETPMAVVIKHITEPLPLPRQIVPDLPEEVERVILKALAKKPEDRFQTVREMVEALDLAVRAATAAAPTAARVEREVVPPAAPARRFRWPWDTRTTALGVGLAALVLLVIGGMFFALSRIQYRVQVVGGRVEVVPVSTEAVTPTPAVALVETPTEAVVATSTPRSTATPTATATATSTPIPIPTPTATPTPTVTSTNTPTPTPEPAKTTTPTEIFVSGLNGPFGMTFNSSGDLFVANEGSYGGGNEVSKITLTGVALTFAAGLVGPAGVAFNSAGVLHISDDTDRVFRVSPTGHLSVFIDSNVGLSNPNAIGFDQADNLYVVNAGGFVSKFDAAGSLIDLNLAGGFHCPQAIVVDDNAGVLFISDMDGNIFQINKETGGSSLYVQTFAFTEGGLARDNNGNLYLSAFNDGLVLRIDALDRTVTTCLSELSQPRGLAFDSSGRLYVTSYETGQIFRAEGCEPDQARAFAEPILAAIAGRTPDYANDFDHPSDDWPSGPGISGHPSHVEGEMGFDGGEYFATAGARGREQWACYGGDSLISFPADFVLDITGRLTPSTDPNGDGDWQIQFRKWELFDGFYVLIVSQDRGVGLVRHGPGEGEKADLANYPAPFEDVSEANRFQIIARGSETAVYANGEPLFYVDDSGYSDRYGAGTINLGVCNLSDAPLQARWDNLRIWDISDLELPSAETTPAP